MRKLLVRIVVGSIRQGRKSHAVAQYLQSRSQDCPGLTTELVDLADYPLPLLETRVDEENSPPVARALFHLLGEADGLVVVAPEYKGGVPGALKNAFDYLPPKFLRHKPVGICTVSAGGYGGMNCLAQLRLLALALGGLAIPDFVAVSKVGDVVDGGAVTLERALDGKLDSFWSEMIWYCTAMARQKQSEECRAPEAPSWIAA